MSNEKASEEGKGGKEEVKLRAVSKERRRDWKRSRSRGSAADQRKRRMGGQKEGGTTFF